MGRFKRASNDQQDQYVLTVFLPLLAIAILACAGGCCYMERRRRRRKKRNGGIDPEELRQQQDFNDTESIISTASTRKRHYLNPTQTTGRLVRGVSVRSNYSTLGEPLYETFRKEKNRRNHEDSRRNLDPYDIKNHGARNWPNYDVEGRQSFPNGGGYGDRPLSRSRSMTDIRYGSDNNGHFRRTRSSNNLDKFRSSAGSTAYGYPADPSIDSEVDNMYDNVYLNSKTELQGNKMPNKKYDRPPSPAQSNWSIHTAPLDTGYNNQTNSLFTKPLSRPSSMVDFPLSETSRETRAFSRVRSMSQPHLNAIPSKTYPQGILKKEYVSSERRNPEMSNHTSYSSDSGIKDIYGEIMERRPSANTRQHMIPHTADDLTNFRPSSRPASSIGFRSNSTRGQNYDSPYSNRYGNFSVGMPTQTQYQQHSAAYREPPVYSITGNGYMEHQPRQDIYAGNHRNHNYDSYPMYGSGYDWGQQMPNHRHRYSSSIY